MIAGGATSFKSGDGGLKPQLPWGSSVKRWAAPLPGRISKHQSLILHPSVPAPGGV